MDASKLKAAIVWLSRIRYCRGFGIQSPSDYQFVRYVINEHYPYYAYNVLSKSLSVSAFVERKLYELYFRTANFLQPDFWVDYCRNPHFSSVYVNSGCNTVKFVHRSGYSDYDSLSNCIKQAVRSTVIRISLTYSNEILVDCVLSNAVKNTVFIVEDIYDGFRIRQEWKKIVDDARAIITFDLFYCGIVFFDSSRVKQHYKINF